MEVTVQVKFKLLVSDKNVSFLGEEPSDEQIASIVAEAIRWDQARTFAVKEVSFDIELLPPASALTVEPTFENVSSPDVKAKVDAYLERKRLADRDEYWRHMIDALGPGKFEVTVTEYTRGVTRIK